MVDDAARVPHTTRGTRGSVSLARTPEHKEAIAVRKAAPPGPERIEANKNLRKHARKQRWKKKMAEKRKVKPLVLHSFEGSRDVGEWHTLLEDKCKAKYEDEKVAVRTRELRDALMEIAETEPDEHITVVEVLSARAKLGVCKAAAGDAVVPEFVKSLPLSVCYEVGHQNLRR